MYVTKMCLQTNRISLCPEEQFYFGLWKAINMLIISENLKQICRTCCSSLDNELYEIHNLQERIATAGHQMSHIRDMLQECIPSLIKNLNNPKYPQNICINCMEELKRSFEFVKKCSDADETLTNVIVNGTEGLMDDKVSEQTTNNFEFVYIENNSSIESKLDQTELIKDCEEEQNDKQRIQLLELPKNEPENVIKTNSKLVEKRLKKANISVYLCRKCDKCYKHYVELLQHNEEHPRSDEIVCRFCNQEFQHRRNIAPHIAKEHHATRSYICGYCNFVSHGNYNEILSHITCEHNDISTTISDEKDNKICHICQKSFKSSVHLKKHLLCHDPDKFPCTKCTRSFFDKETLDTHILVIHSSNESNQCIHCHKVFMSKRLLRQHMISHKKTKRFKCKFCAKGFNLAQHLQRHERIHTKECPYLCSECGKSFATIDRLRFHETVHSGERPFKCSICDKTFPWKNSLNVHLKIHTGEKRTMSCKLCCIDFTSAHLYYKHLNELHRKPTELEQSSKDENIYFCGICSKFFESSLDLSEHMKLHTFKYHCDTCSKSFSLKSALEKHLQAHLEGSRSFICDTCNEGFNRAEHLKSHIMRRHIGLRPFKCNVCEKSFFQMGCLNTHMRSHTGERPFQCKICSKSFSQSNGLRTHMRTHTGERPYICAICDIGFSTSSGLKMHMQKHNRVIGSEVLNTKI